MTFPRQFLNSLILNKSVKSFSQRLSLLFLSIVVLFFTSCEKKEAVVAVHPPIPVTLTVVEQKDMPNNKEWIGNLQGTVTSLVKPNVSGNIIQRYYTEGSVVKQGEPLFQIDPAPFQAILDQAKADLASSQADATRMEQDFVRAQNLLEGKVISIQEFQNKQQAYQASVGQVAAKQAAVQSAQVNLDFTKVVSPIDGLAGLANYEVGTYVSPQSSDPLTTVVAIDPIKVVFQVGQDDYLGFISNRLHDPNADPEENRAKSMRMLLSDGTVYAQQGKFRAANNQVSTQTGSITVEGLFPNPGMLLRPGLFARVQAALGVQKNAIVVPIAALITIQNINQLAVVGSDNKVTIKNVTLGLTTRDEAVILTGVEPGEKIVMQGIQKVTDGCSIQLLPTAGGKSENMTNAPSSPSEKGSEKSLSSDTPGAK